VRHAVRHAQQRLLQPFLLHLQMPVAEHAEEKHVTNSMPKKQCNGSSMLKATRPRNCNSCHQMMASMSGRLL
jgi:hypothetical protein